MVSMLAAAVSFTACSDSDEEVNTPAPAPTVTLAQGVVTAESITFTLTPTDAVKAAWVYFEAGEREVTADQVLANGSSADADKASTLEASPLSSNTAYVIYAAVEGANGDKVLSAPLEVTTLPGEDDPVGEPVEFEAVSASAEGYGGTAYGDWVVVFKDENENEVSLYLLTESTERDYLRTEEFELGSVKQAGTIFVDEDSYVLLDGEKYTPASGELFIEAEVAEDGTTVNYGVEGALTLADGREVILFYEGEIEGCAVATAGKETVQIQFTHAELNTNQEQDAGVFYVKFDDRDEWNYDAAFVFKAGESDTYLPSNSYSLEDGTILSNSHINSSYARDWSSASASVVFEGSAYIISLNFEDENTVYSATYEGEIEGMAVPKTLIMEECYFQVYLSPDDENGGYQGTVMITDVDVSTGNYEGMMQAHNLWVHSATEYLSGEYLFMTAEAAAAQGVTNYIEKDDFDSSYGALYDETGQMSYYGSYASFELYAGSLMPDKNINEISFQGTMGNGTICQGFFSGAIPTYQISVSTEPVDTPIYVSSIDAFSMGGMYSLIFHTLDAELSILFICYADKFAAGKYVFSDDMDDPADMSFMGSYVTVPIDWAEEEKEYTIESGNIGVIRPTTDGGDWVFQFQDVIARADDGSARNLGPSNSEGLVNKITKPVSGLE